ncbi:FtsQ-type POTRA domain-containing protein [Bacillus sp. 165]|uniref:cell division protein FtsQ/DivIB n=1 Tax=Bacillus sp. 165 TaxID=1529117 RepID=UPI001ADA5D6A|nr:FtsQ-type POTRA domain-containing protein [Bacillus sp. 165]MBO9130262.1 FtsQ-type POTRA domain-containing protein [Bacillus sp. 165]
MREEKVIQLNNRVPKLKDQKRKKANRRLILYVSILFLLLACVTYFRSPLGDVSSISIKGNHYLTDKQIMKISGITYQTDYFRTSAKKAKQNLIAQKEIKNASIKKIFPNKIAVTIEEYKTVGYIKKRDKWYPLLENGTLLSPIEGKQGRVSAPFMLNWSKDKHIKEMALELKKLPDSIFRSISEISFAPLSSDPLHITLYMNEGYEVSASVRDFAEKMRAYPLILEQAKEYKKGIIHLEVGAYFEPYATEDEKNNEN